MGEATRAITRDDVVEALDGRDRDENPVVTASQLAEFDEIGTSHVTARRRLEELQEDGRVNVAKVAGTRVWWLEDELVVRDEDGDLRPATPPAEDVDRGEGEAVADGGLSPGVAILQRVVGVAPRTENERGVMRTSASQLAMVGVLSFLSVLAAVLHGVFVPGPPSQPIYIVVGLAMFAAVGYAFLAITRLVLLRAGWYADPTAPATSTAETA
jgi:hypothetical protein